jgi:hypothetical protein
MGHGAHEMAEDHKTVINEVGDPELPAERRLVVSLPAEAHLLPRAAVSGSLLGHPRDQLGCGHRCAPPVCPTPTRTTSEGRSGRSKLAITWRGLPRAWTTLAADRVRSPRRRPPGERGPWSPQSPRSRSAGA